MMVRRIHPEELWRSEAIRALCFDYAMENRELTPEAYAQRILQGPESCQEVHWDGQWSAFTDEGEMISTVSVIPWEAAFDGHKVPLAGIGGVATLPQYRKQGGVRAIFTQALPQMYRDGMALSYLYPFSTAFYGKFGYAPGAERVVWHLALEPLRRLRQDGCCRLCEGEREASAIAALDDLFCSQYNLMITQTALKRRWLQKERPFSGKRWTHVYYAPDGAPKGYVTCETLREGDRRLLHCPRLVFVDLEGLRGLLAHLSGYAADYEEAVLRLPVTVRPDALLEEWSFGQVRRETELNGMVRAIDAAALLERATAKEPGELRIAISDPWIPENHATFAVTLQPGQLNRVERTQEPPDIELDIRDFSRLIVGVASHAPQWQPGLQIHRKEAALQQFFAAKPCMITQFF